MVIDNEYGCCKFETETKLSIEKRHFSTISDKRLGISTEINNFYSKLSIFYVSLFKCWVGYAHHSSQCLTFVIHCFRILQCRQFIKNLSDTKPAHFHFRKGLLIVLFLAQYKTAPLYNTPFSYLMFKLGRTYAINTEIEILHLKSLTQA